jgi:rare lipoprotein A
MSELALILAMILSPAARAEPRPAQPVATAEVQASVPDKPAAKPKLDRSGKTKHGKASYYHDRFAGRKMANGQRMDPTAATAASRTLPLGTKAVVTNLKNGRSAEVEITDRGPYVEGRTVDVTPKIAEDLGMKKEGVTDVVVAPIQVPMPDGSVKTGDASASASAGAGAPATATR